MLQEVSANYFCEKSVNLYQTRINSGFSREYSGKKEPSYRFTRHDSSVLLMLLLLFFGEALSPRICGVKKLVGLVGIGFTEEFIIELFYLGIVV